jgi:hypothetical protein
MYKSHANTRQREQLKGKTAPLVALVLTRLNPKRIGNYLIPGMTIRFPEIALGPWSIRVHRLVAAALTRLVL